MLLISAGILQKFILLGIIRCCKDVRFLFSIVTTGIIYFSLCTWLVYGNYMYFSSQNDCQAREETSPMAQLMLFFISVGYLQILYGLTYAYLMPQAIMRYFFLQSLERKANQEILQVSESLNRVGFDPLVHKYESTCAICLLDFETDDMIC